LAPQATNNTWYPYSFIAPPASNEPWLSSALTVLKEIVDDVVAKGILPANIYFLGFSQGACLSLESAARKARKFGGVIAFTGGLIGDAIHKEKYSGEFQGTPVFIGTGDPDPHVPVQRVKDSTKLLQDMGAIVTEKIFPGIGHTIIQQEFDFVNKHILPVKNL